MVSTRGQQKAREQKQQELRDKFKTEARPDVDDSTMAKWPPPAPYNRRKRIGPSVVNGTVDWAALPDSCLLRVFECLNAEKAQEAVSAS